MVRVGSLLGVGAGEVEGLIEGVKAEVQAARLKSKAKRKRKPKPKAKRKTHGATATEVTSTGFSLDTPQCPVCRVPLVARMTRTGPAIPCKCTHPEEFYASGSWEQMEAESEDYRLSLERGFASRTPRTRG